MVFIWTFLLAAAAQAAEPSLILHSGRIFIAPGQYAQALAVAGNRIMDVGPDDKILSLKGPKTRVVDLAGRAVTPGFHDAHANFFEGALSLVQRASPPASHEELLEALRRALALARRSGVTSLQSFSGIVAISPQDQLSLWRELYRGGEFTARFFLYGRLEDSQDFAALKKEAAPFPRSRLGLVAVEGSVDGEMEGRTAALLEPYFDDASTRGEPKISQSRLASLILEAQRRGFMVSLHAAGDRAVRMSLDACEKAELKSRAESLVLPPYPCKIEQLELVDPADLPRFAKLHVAASMQPGRMTRNHELQNNYPERLGDRVRYALAWRSLEKAGAALVFGSNWPDAPLEPRINLYAAATRRHFDGKPEGGWVPQQKIALESAIVHSTADPADVIGRGDDLGRIKTGFLADLVVFDRDLFAAPASDLLKVEVAMTIYDGRVVYERPAKP